MTRFEWKLTKARAGLKTLTNAASSLARRIKALVPFFFTATVSAGIVIASFGLLSMWLQEVTTYFEQSQVIVYPPAPTAKSAPSVPKRPVTDIIISDSYKFAMQAVFKVIPAYGDRKLQASGGTGFLLELPESGRLVIMSNRHVCIGVDQEGRKQAVLVQGTKVYFTTINYISKLTDICVIDVPQELLKHKPYQVAKSPRASYVEGRALFVFGHPRLMPLAMSEAIFVNYTKEYFEPDLPSTRGFGRIFAEIHPGNSGSPIVNARNEVVGVIFAYERLPDQPPAGLFIPIEHGLDAATDNE